MCIIPIEAFKPTTINPTFPENTGFYYVSLNFLGNWTIYKAEVSTRSPFLRTSIIFGHRDFEVPGYRYGVRFCLDGAWNFLRLQAGSNFL